MNNLLIDIVDYLASIGIVEGDGVDSFRDTRPDKPDNVVALYEYSGSPTPLQDMAVHRSVQVTVRNISATKARTKCIEIFNVLSPVDRYLRLSDSRWVMLYPRQYPFKLKTDENGRHIYAFNLGITSERD